MRQIGKQSLTRSLVGSWMVLAAVALVACAEGEGEVEQRAPTAAAAAGSGADVAGLTQDLLAGTGELYQSCSPGGSNLQGDCRSGLVCQTIIRGGFRCYRSAANGCAAGTTSYMGVACLNTCSGSSGFCPYPLACEFGWCVP